MQGARYTMALPLFAASAPFAGLLQFGSELRWMWLLLYAFFLLHFRSVYLVFIYKNSRIPSQHWYLSLMKGKSSVFQVTFMQKNEELQTCDSLLC